MKTRLLFFIFAIGSSVLLFSTCKKNKKEASCSGDPSQCHSVLEAKDYFAFKLGSWWVYEEENSGVRDSVYVTESSIDPNGYNFNVRMYSTYQEYYYHYWPEYYGGPGIPSCSETDPVDKRCLYVKRSKYQYGNYIGESYCYFINSNIGSYIYTGGGVDYCQNNKIIVENVFKNNFIVNNDNYSNTIQIHDQCTFVEGKQPTNFYYSKGVGIVKKELIDSNQVWNLVNYHIE